MSHTIQSPSGTWTAPVYARVTSLSFPNAAPWTAGARIIVGADIKLQFAPSPALQPGSTSIRLVQFRKLLPGGEAYWEVDRAAARRLPYLGWDDAGGPMVLPTSLRGVGSPLEDRVGFPRAQHGSVPQADSGGSPQPAFVIDTPREPFGGTREKQAEYRTYAFDETNNRWLGGVTVGRPAHPFLSSFARYPATGSPFSAHTFADRQPAREPWRTRLHQGHAGGEKAGCGFQIDNGIQGVRL